MEESAVLPAPVRKWRARRLALRVLRIVVIVYLVLCVLLYFGQDWLVFPAAKSQGTADAIIHPEHDSEQVDLRTVQGDHVAALFGKALLPDGSVDPQAATRPTIIYFYGNGGAIAWSMIEFDRFRRLDANCLIPDFVGFGMSSGKPSEVNLYATADASYDYLIHRGDIDSKKIISMGWSIGGAVAVDLASRKPAAGLVTFNAFTTMPAVAHLMLPWFPTSLFLKYRFDNATKIAGISCPVLICNGLKDTLVPATMADELARLAKGPVTRVTIKSADHNNIFSAEPKDLFSSLQIFVNQVANPR
jgi:fermentation-respiration switch protein FrsA (DUF1100 family)